MAKLKCWRVKSPSGKIITQSNLSKKEIKNLKSLGFKIKLKKKC